jgi:cytochrome c-type biogenesis protein
MPGGELAGLVLLPIGLGLFGFVEPCAIGATLLFIKTMEGAPARTKVAQVVAFTISRAVFTGLLGAIAVVIGALFLGLQKAVWLAVGLLYAGIGVLYLTGRIAPLMRSIGPRLTALSSPRGSIALGGALGLVIPACAAPLLLALLAMAAAGGASGANIAQGFASLALFGFALSLPLVAAVLFAPARRALDWIAALTRRIPFWTGMLFVALGLFSIWFGLFVTIR